MKQILEEKHTERRLLLHACCAPCACVPIELLKSFFDITLLFYNPNITDKEEYAKRLLELKEYIKNRNYTIEIIELPYNSADFYAVAQGRESEKEGKDRCFECYNLRLKKAAEIAKNGKFDLFGTVLSISPHKNSQKINEIGEVLESQTGVKFLPADFKKEGGFLESLKISKEYGLYRQNYCGCEFSKRDRTN